ncbi:histidinol-phosphatase HisJ [Oceanobacillus polygoni]|uniref:Histidinol-phosphatase n=1 Tax=Oceanobacillus polygoni TaxID=1235259 RepID=A0A9X0YVE8_9BACI|nr:histidinol-phosphatase HisJ [Oceanobacillus polygoni]MBP2079583.1 histidinol-phosphatase (PHP family) [Oceanobacillus polygoni]
MKKDGHTHTEFCPHGSGEDVELFIQKAIGLGFTDYSITEHNPLPQGFTELAAGENEAIATAGMSITDVEYYLNKMHRLKKKYENEIRVHVGFEIDYVTGFEGYTTDFLNEYGKWMDDSILSLHFLQGKGGYRSIDFSPQDYQDGIITHYGSFQKGQENYFQTLLQLVDADLGKYKPKRIGHITLCQKFQNYYENEETRLSKRALQLVDELLDKIKGKNYELDFNTAGMFKPYCGEPYPSLPIMEKVIEKQVRYVYGSDSHHVTDVGRGYPIVPHNNERKREIYAGYRE